MTPAHEALLPGGVDVAFGDLPDVLAHSRDQLRAGPRARALWATAVVVGPDARLNEAADALRMPGGDALVRGILISVGDASRPVPRVAGEIVALSGLKPSYVNNAVAALRLSSLPTILWWRGGRLDILRDLTRLAERVVLDGEPDEAWPHAVELFEDAAFSDLRWTRLTRWRAVMAQLFEIHEVRRAAPGFSRLRIAGADAIAASLFTHWIAAALGRAGAIQLEFVPGHTGAFIEEIRLGDGGQELALQLLPNATCVSSSVVLRAHRAAARTVPLGDQSLAALMTEELRVRARDRAFEAAVRAYLRRS